MPPKKVIPTTRFCCYFFLLLTFISHQAYSQCAGEDNTHNVCDISNPANQSINLFNLLNGSPTAGGTWNDPSQTDALDETTGMLNIWSINFSGSYLFTYTVTGADGCTDNSATITIVIGGYSGIPSPGSVCSEDNNINLFQFFTGAEPNPQLNGTWSDDDATGALNENVFDAVSAGEGTYSFTYTMPAIGNCPATSSTTTVTVHRSPEPGTPEMLELCSSDDLAVYSNFDLFELLTDEDSNGSWTESGTSELASPFDSFINVANLYNSFGAGTYSFTYTVNPNHPICDTEEVTVNIVIEDPLDLSNATLQVNSDICEDQIATATYAGVLSDNSAVDGTYQITVAISGATSGEFTADSQFVAGILNFNIDSAYFSAAGQYNITVTDIVAAQYSGVCQTLGSASDTLNIFATPDMAGAAVVINPVCEETDIEVMISGANNLADGNYQLTYNLSGNNIMADQQVTIAFTAGSGSFTIPAASLPNTGETTINFTTVVNVQTGCSAPIALIGTIVINETPDPASFSILIDNVCLGEVVTVLVSGLDGLNNVDFTYSLSGANSSVDQSISVALNSGNGTFDIASNLLPNPGATTITITSITNNETECGSTTFTENFSFEINPIAGAPIAQDAVFCETENATIADLTPSGDQFQWFASATDTNPISADFVLVTGSYYVSESNSTNDCASERAMITVTINTVETPTLVQDGDSFCGVDNPTLQDLTANINVNGTITWFDAASNGNELPPTELLTNGMTYYGLQFSEPVNCFSAGMLAVTVDLSACEDDEDIENFFVPDAFSPNGDGVNDTFRIPDIEFLYPDFSLEIYNRYGNLMFTGNNNRPDWNGKNGISNLVDGTAPNGVYFYIIRFNKDNKSPKQGRLYLNR